MNTQGARRLLTFRLDQEQRQRLKARLARDGRTMSEVVTHGLHQYVQPVCSSGTGRVLFLLLLLLSFFFCRESRGV